MARKAKVRGKGAYVVRSAEGRRASHRSSNSDSVKRTESLIKALRAKQKRA